MSEVLTREEQEFRDALATPGAKLLLHPDDVERLKKGASERFGIPIGAVEVITNQWVQRGTMQVLPPGASLIPASRPMSESFPTPELEVDDGWSVTRCDFCGEPAYALKRGACPSCERLGR